MDEPLAREYALADLGRERQEELPLNRKSNKGSSFTPSGRNGTDHISRAVKTQLQKGWADPVRDEESEQVEGLAIDECPWRKAKGGSNKVTRPQLQPLPSQPKRPRTSHHNTNSIAKDNMSAIISAIPEASNFSLASISERDERPSRRNSRLVEGLPKSNSCGPVTNGIDPNFGEGDSSYNDRF
jgi:hypothetical protein